MHICQPIRFIQRICVELAASKYQANFARKVAGDPQMRAHAFANASTRKRKFNATRTKFHLSPTVNGTSLIVNSFSKNVCAYIRNIGYICQSLQ